MAINSNKLTVALASTAACLMIGATAKAQVSGDAILDKLVAKGILKPEEAEEMKSESATNKVPTGLDFKLSKAIKSAEIFGDLRMRYEYRSAETRAGSRAVRGRLRHGQSVSLCVALRCAR